METARHARIPVIAAVDGYVYETECDIEPGKTTVAEIVEKTAVLDELGLENREDLGYGSYGELKEPGDALNEDDRLEIFQRLKIDPTESRRLRGLEEKKRSKKQSQKSGASGVPG